MNEEYIKEYEEMSLCDFADELVEPLSTIKQDLTKIIYIHYAEERDKYEELQQRIEKAIEYIKSKKCKYDGWEITTQLYEDEIKQLEEILKGEEK